ncbi:PaaX family transcriptional regulator C-terminal domain-containing protein [Ferrovibrio sp.]|uniref:PaaX family transcriptional regulator n=1 Tax=Ferrovibrio sp. TaxID=1917215 RepID=UPI00311FF918
MTEDEILAAAKASFLGRSPPRVWSMIVTIFGDVVVPRGGSVWLGTLLTLMERIGIDGALVRTAMSRLATDGWVERSRVGRKSYYRLSASSLEMSRRAGEAIYAATEPAWNGSFRLLLRPEANGGWRDDVKSKYGPLGFSPVSPNALVALGDAAAPADAIGTLLFDARPVDLAAARDVAERAWGGNALLAMRRSFVANFGPIRDEVVAGDELSDEACLLLRLLMVHEWRRIVLKAPEFPAALSTDPAAWGAAREVAASLWQACRGPSERWLDQHAASEDGPFPVVENGFNSRFQ